MSEKATFSSNDLSPHLSEKAKFSLWQEIHNDQIWSVDYRVADAAPFHAEIEAVAVGQLVIGQMAGTIKHASRQANNVAKDGRDGYLLLINKTRSELRGTQVGRQYAIGLGAAALVSASEPLTMSGGDANAWMNLVIPHQALATPFRTINDLLANPIAAGNEALGLLVRYCRFLETGPALVSNDLIAHAAETIIDLVGLSTGAKGNAAELAGLRGLRAARLAAILGRIEADFTNHLISAQVVAGTLGVSVRYVHDLLMETGISFTERVLELRLQRALQMLSDRSCGRMLVSEIAFAVGFSDVAYFNRSFRRRFGATPSSVR